MHLSIRRSNVLCWAGLLLVLLAVVAIAVPGVGYVRTMNADGLSLSNGPLQVSVSNGRSYGIYVDDADNSGYSLACSAADAEGQRIQLDDPPWSISSSDTETLDLAFKAGPGELSVTCDIPGEQVTLRPLPDNHSLEIGILLAAIFGCSGMCLLIAWAARSTRTPTSPLGTSAAGGPAGPWIPTDVAAQGATNAQSVTMPAPTRRRDLVPAIVATTVAVPILAMSALNWLVRIAIVRTAFDDPELWNGHAPGHGPSLGQVVRSTWTDLIPVAIGIVLVLAVWRLAWRDLTTAAWIVTVLALVLAIVNLIL